MSCGWFFFSLFFPGSQIKFFQEKFSRFLSLFQVILILQKIFLTIIISVFSSHSFKFLLWGLQLCVLDTFASLLVSHRLYLSVTSLTGVLFGFCKVHCLFCSCQFHLHFLSFLILPILKVLPANVLSSIITLLSVIILAFRLLSLLPCKWLLHQVF